MQKIEKDAVTFEAKTTFLVLPTEFIGVIPIGVTTPSVLNVTKFKLINVAPVSITNFLNGQLGQIIQILGDGYTTLVHGTFIKTNTGLDKLLAINSLYQFGFFNNGSVNCWIELADANSGGGGTVVPSHFINVVWGTPGAEISDAIEVAASSFDVNANVINSSEIAVTVIVSDGASDTEPSATATIDAATVPVGTLLAGGGTATAMFKTNASGQFSIRVSEASAGDRYIWLRAGGHFQRFVKARDGILQLTFA